MADSRTRKSSSARVGKKKPETTKERLARKQRKKRGILTRIAVIVIVAAVVAILSVQIIHLRERNAAYKAQEKQLQAEIDSEKERSEELKDAENYVNSDEYIEDEARSKLGMAKDDEIIFKEK